MINPLVGMPQGLEWLVILAIVVLVFGAAKLPDLARSSGQALRIFKTETKDLRDDSSAKDAHTTTEQREIESLNEATGHETTGDVTPGDVVRERRDDTTA